MVKVDRRIARTQEAIKKAFLELMSEKSFDSITIQNIADRANINRATVYLHYLDKFDLLDKIMEEHIENMSDFCESEADLNWIDSTTHCMKYLESNYLFFSTMLASEGARYFRNRFLQHNIEEFKKDVDITKGKNLGQNEDVIVEFVANAYVGVVEWWLKNEMPYSPKEMAEKVGNLLERNL
ncbi:MULTISPECIES: TetR/AcrR family transcriptional regulator [Priestia]|jgi:AcrR family transcriptional regulator|uniref:TetR/AcrR family transcriptional regulator n=1 Tax=Priestia TaxID=2800373 RepID=UPI0007109D1B|nr:MULTISPECIES: TetR/AcrR family transcriptional regulator [Priestia]KRD99081.1 TetR family transcriptional regulator [Bacillus sp. Root239]MBY0094291.1 TetR/AcrR family transcriptional regulator [Priestia aryabhattai]MBY0103606.1 TetR/AcrR family transcriptional regulator [Priestia aryabhattai]MCM3545584.1 TetR/AcrR family transcriptional regulator [Priestia megaterium]MEC1069508.1 TetR/AcrR family transcriptional regulator [Priestia megaterium]